MFLMDTMSNGLINSPHARISVIIQLGICDPDTPINQVFFREFLEFVLPVEIDDYCTIFIEYHERDIHNYNIEHLVIV